MNVLVTGSQGFIGQNLLAWLTRRSDVCVLPFDQENTRDELTGLLAESDFVYHLAGVNRPPSVDEYDRVNAGLTADLCATLLRQRKAIPVVFSSSIQADLDNPYGLSKARAEQILTDYAARGGCAIIYRLKNVFGKWCRPNYNSVVATFCHNVAHDLPITISDPDRSLQVVYIDDVIEHFIGVMAELPSAGVSYREVTPYYEVTVGGLAERIRAFRAIRTDLHVPDLSDPFTRKLYATYLAYLDENALGYGLEQRCDARGCLAEFAKSALFGQIFVSRTLPGVTRGNHYHHTKTEKFLVLEGEAIIRLRHIREDEVIEYRVTGAGFRVVDIPPGYTHSIENVGRAELVTLFWASEPFDATRPDTYGLPVLEGPK